MRFFIRFVVVLTALLAPAWLVAQEPPASGNAKAVGTVQSISGNSLTLKSDAGAAVTVTLQDSTRVLRSEPGQKSLKEATPIQFSDVQAGDRMLTSGKASDDGKTIAATTIVVMKQGDIASKQSKEREDWQRRSVGGLVANVDATGNTVKISTLVMAQKKEITVKVSPNTIVRRYAPDSVKFDDATKSTLAEIKPGDQLRARGDRNPDGSEINADEIVSGTFRNVSGTVQSVDKTKNELTVMDLATKKPVSITIASDSQMRKLPEMMAQRIAARLKGGPSDGQGSTPGANASQPQVGEASAAGQGARRGTGGGGMGSNGGAMRGNGGDMLQLVLSRAPAVQLTDLQKGDAVMLVATQGSPAAPPTAITLLAGVEPILSAGSKGGDTSTILSPWNLGGTGGGDASAAQ